MLFIDYDPSVGNMCAVAGIKANTRADTGNSPNVISILGQHLHSWHNNNNYVQDKSIGVSSIFHVLSLFALDLVMCAVCSYITHTVKNSLLILYYHLICCVSCLRLRNAIGFVIPRGRVISRSICFNSAPTLNYKHDC